MNNEEGPRRKNGKKVKKEEGPPPVDQKKEEGPPPPPPRPRGFRWSHKQHTKKLNKEEGPPPPPAIREFIRSSRHTDMSMMCPTTRPLCLLSHPNNPHTLLLRSGEINGDLSKCFSCRKSKSWNIDQFYFYCSTCKVVFHSGCHKFPRKVTHPYHLHHPLTFTFRNYETGVVSDGYIDKPFWNMVLSEANTSESNAVVPKKFGSVQASRSQSDIVFDKCTWCGENIQDNWYYRCSICNFCLDLSCFQNILLLIIPNPKSHHHPLVFYPRPLLTPCDACGLVNVLDPSYACFQCDYMVHRSCIDLPRVIKITRHQHRLFHTPFFHPIASPCSVCYKALDIKYGLYSCNHEDRSYVVHSKCGTHEHVWDGKELEWEPEELSDAKDIAPFKKVGSDMINYFSHEHLLRLEEYDSVRDAEKRCRACVLPLNYRDFYDCIKSCDFSLHEACAGLARKLDHALHVHPLVLDVFPSQNLTSCSVCTRTFTGFKYKCSEEDCAVLNTFQVDVCCVLVQDYFIHKSHEHPLFISTSYRGESTVFCKGCKEICPQFYLQCSVCKFAMCYRCVTVPTELYYKHDKHPLSLCYGEKGVDDIYWCEICEKEVNPRGWFYTCNKCCITIHLRCVFGSSAYMKPGFKFRLYQNSTKMKVVHNSKSTRPFCTTCGQRCPSSLYYKFGPEKTYCSLDCFVAKEEKVMVLSA